ncbi:BglII/BstYI family type II restriction endonuclease [Xanthomonas vasicola]|uniref:Restriction endonuclease n=1 Tax=Xanthomonas vasicola TaxID=56459 RepID=G3JXD4_XANVA|nr:BglII/BstYI family type II restriction endonuclease [Xanthomonas vasicola]AEN19717.1 XhoII [Xanthomonas vasicola]KGR40175.1 restriction endonuclease BglII [Xanthomonas vasicola]KGR42760.1 restriction endonuclease BglII [Xanthomonas vasicola]KGR58127.1 restriction endonuclease BglII [Xanthomonas vasicola]MDO6986719.1 BglII/BstYI family type II restriction endonuclease [Xanthomonas vasicola]
MKVAKIYSHLNGLEFLKVHHEKVILELDRVITRIDAEACRTKETKEARKAGRFADGLLYSPVALNEAFNDALSQLHWYEDRYSYFVTDDARLIRATLGLDRAEQKRIIEDAGHKAIATYNQTDFVKDRVAIEVQFGKYSFVAYDLFVKHMAFYVGDKIDVGIEILPMKSLQENMSSGIAYYESELSNLVRQGRGVPAVPLVLMGIEP